MLTTLYFCFATAVVINLVMVKLLNDEVAYAKREAVRNSNRAQSYKN